MEEAKKRDHRNVGVQQDLFFFHQLSPGSAFFLPCGGRIYNTLIELMREKYWEYEYEEVRGGCAWVRMTRVRARARVCVCGQHGGGGGDGRCRARM
jgi:hypothetical protein